MVCPPPLPAIPGDELIEMKLKEYAVTWPPDITIGDASHTPRIPPRAELADVVLDVKNGFFGELVIRLRRSKYREYTVTVPVPGSLQRKIMFDIVRQKSMTLRDIGELPIRENTSASVGKNKRGSK